MKKVLILANNDVGLYKFRKELIEELLKDYEVYISLPYGNFVNDLINIGCNFIDTTIDRRGINPINDLKLICQYKRLVKKICPDIILSYTIKPNIYGAYVAKKRNIPVFANITGLGSAVENGGLLQKITVLMYKFAFSKIQTVFFQNKENMQFFEDKKIAVGKHKLLPGSGVNLQHFKPLKYPDDKTTEFVFISRIMKEKGIDQYLEAAKYIRNKYPNTRFHICGFCEEDYEDILKEYQNQGIIIYHGLLDDVRKILKITHCTIHPTYYPEGMSNVLLESCACARPIITTDRSGCKEIVDNGVNGYIVKQKDSRDLIDKIEKFLNLSYEDKKSMGLYARNKVESEFDRNIVVNIYKQILNII